MMNAGFSSILRSLNQSLNRSLAQSLAFLSLCAAPLLGSQRRVATLYFSCIFLGAPCGVSR